MNSCTDNNDEIPGTLMGILENNLIFRSKFREIIVIFNTKTLKIIEGIKDLAFGTIDLRYINFL